MKERDIHSDLPRFADGLTRLYLRSFNMASYHRCDETNSGETEMPNIAVWRIHRNIINAN